MYNNVCGAIHAWTDVMYVCARVCECVYVCVCVFVRDHVCNVVLCYYMLEFCFVCMYAMCACVLYVCNVM